MMRPIEIMSISAVAMMKGIAAARSRRAGSNLKRAAGGAGSVTGIGAIARGRSEILSEAWRETARCHQFPESVLIARRKEPLEAPLLYRKALKGNVCGNRNRDRRERLSNCSNSLCVAINVGFPMIGKKRGHELHDFDVQGKE